jgi:hypothetical protein
VSVGISVVVVGDGDGIGVIVLIVLAVVLCVSYVTCSSVHDDHTVLTQRENNRLAFKRARVPRYGVETSPYFDGCVSGIFVIGIFSLVSLVLQSVTIGECMSATT